MLARPPSEAQPPRETAARPGWCRFTPPPGATGPFSQYPVQFDCFAIVTSDFGSAKWNEVPAFDPAATKGAAEAVSSI
jgi:hypothetical protein